MASLLAENAAECGAEGISKEDWITGVLKGHAGDDQMQLECLRRIVELWSNGPWPWPEQKS